jgi:hypothetical protein
VKFSLLSADEVQNTRHLPEFCCELTAPSGEKHATSGRVGSRDSTYVGDLDSDGEDEATQDEMARDGSFEGDEDEDEDVAFARAAALEAKSAAGKSKKPKAKSDKPSSGIVVKLMLNDFELKGEPGKKSKVPTLKFEQIGLELEVYTKLQAVFKPGEGGDYMSRGEGQEEQEHGKWVAGKEFKIKLVRFSCFGAGKFTAMVANKVIALVRPLISRAICKLLPPELGSLLSTRDGLHIDLEAEFDISGQYTVTNLDSKLSSSEGVQLLRPQVKSDDVEGLRETGKVGQAVKQFAELLGALSPAQRAKLPKLDTVLQLARYVSARRNASQIHLEEQEGAREDITDSGESGGSKATSAVSSTSSGSRLPSRLGDGEGLTDWEEMVAVWKSLARAAAASSGLDFNIHADIDEDYNDVDEIFNRVFENARVLHLKPIKTAVTVQQLSIRLGALPAVRFGRDLVLRLMREAHFKKASEAVATAKQVAKAARAKEKDSKKGTKGTSRKSMKGMSFGSVLALAQVNADLDDPTTSVLATNLAKTREGSKFAEMMIGEVAKNLKCFSTEVEGKFQGGDRFDVGVNDLRYDGPLQMMLPLQDIIIPAWLDGGDEFSPFGYDIILGPRKTGHYAIGVHSSKELYEMTLGDRKQRALEAVEAEQNDLSSQSSTTSSRYNSLNSSLCASTPIVPIYEGQQDADAAAKMSGLDDFGFEDDDEDEALLDFEELAWEELEDPTVEPIIEALLGNIDLEVYVDPISAEEQQAQEMRQSRLSFTEENSLWRQNGWDPDDDDRRIGLQVGVGVPDQEDGEDDEGAWEEYGEDLGRTLDIRVATGTSAGTRFRLSSASIGANTDRFYTHCVKLLFMSLEGDTTTSDHVVFNLRQLLSRVWGYLQKDTLLVLFNLMASLDVLPPEDGAPSNVSSNVRLTVDPVMPDDDTTVATKEIVRVGIEFNLVTLVDDIVSSAKNVSAW